MRSITLIGAALSLTVAGAAHAHPKLLSASPAQGAAVSKPARLQLTFSEKLVPAFSTADLTMDAMPGMAAMKMASTAKVAPDGKTLVITPKSALPRGRYTVAWRVVSSDTHKVNGTYSFSVK
jgi:copper resistance protein C